MPIFLFATRAARLRSQMGHPVVDADGHWIETAPLLKGFFLDFVKELGGKDLAARFEAAGGLDYDDTVFYLKVMVAWDTDGELKGHVSVRRDGDDGAKTELLFKNSYRSTDPLPPPVTPPYVPDKPTPTPKPVDQPGEITVIRPPTPSAEMPDAVIPAAEPEPVGTLIQTGQLLWPVPVLAGGGIALVAAGLWLSRKRRHDA